MSRVCPSCGYEVRKPGARFCPTCGRPLRSSDRPAGNARLIVAVPGQPVREIPLNRPSLTVGRASDNDIVIPQSHISSRHGWLDRQPDGAWRYTDLESTNGSFLRGQRVQQAVLRDGDVLFLGGPPATAVRLIFRARAQETNRCPRCGAANREGARFCRVCRAPLAPVGDARSIGGLPCPRCGTENRGDARFCRGCGASLQDAVPGASPAFPPAPPPEKSSPPIGGPLSQPRERGRRTSPLGIVAMGILGLFCLLGAAILLSWVISWGWIPSAPVTEDITPTPPAPPLPEAGQLPSRPVEKRLHGYVHSEGEYGFNYPADWEGYIVQDDVLFHLTTGATVRVHVEPAPPEQTLEEYIHQANQFPPVDVLESWETALGGEFAVCQKVAFAGEERLRAVVCFTRHRDRIYIVSLTALDELPEAQQQESLDEFFVLLRSFILQ